MDYAHLDALGGLLVVDDKTPPGKVFLTVSESARSDAKPQAHVLTPDDCVTLAHDLLRRCYRLDLSDDWDADVLAALGALANIADRQDRARALGETVMGDAS